MSQCNKVICKYLDKGICDICIFKPRVETLPPIKSAKKKPKRGRPRTSAINIDGTYTTSNPDITVVRRFLGEMKAQGKLTDTQIDRIKRIGDAKTKKLSSGQKEELLFIFCDARRKKND